MYETADCRPFTAPCGETLMVRQRLDVFVGSHALDQIVCGGVAMLQDACKPVLGKAKQKGS